MKHAVTANFALPDTPVFGSEPWAICETQFIPDDIALRESLFALGNGQLGIRGDFEEGYPAHCPNALPGTYWNGLYVRRPIEYAEIAPGFPRWGDFMPAVMNGRELTLQVNDQALNQGEIVDHQRTLDLRDGHSERRTTWRMPTGETLTVEVKTLVSFSRPGTCAQRITLRAGADAVNLRGVCWLRPTRLDLAHGDDPRISGGAQDQLQWHNAFCDAGQAAMGASQSAANLTLSAVVLTTLSNCHTQPADSQAHHQLGLVFEQQLAAGEVFSFDRVLVYQPTAQPQDVLASARAAIQAGFDTLAQEQASDWQQFWHRAHFSLSGQPVLEQGLRFNLFQLRQSCSREASANIAAKGLSGPGYDGHYFWDSEIYVLPLFSLVEPDSARALLRYRISKLDAARKRAREMSHPQGALYPWRTISGDECSAFFPAGTAQYHINADIAYAVQRYFQDNGDRDFVLNEAAEMVLESARIWLDLGHFNPALEGRFTIHEVTGPDEYSAMVDNNYYTNLLAARHLHFAAWIARQLAAEQPQRWQELCDRIELHDYEVQRWQRAADFIYLPQDQARDISWQDDHFARRPAWDYARHPADDKPMLLKHHPLVLYRHQILKQADVLMAHYLSPEHSSAQRKANDFAYYEPLTTHDSSLSPCVHSIIAAWCGDDSKALAYLHMAVRSDLDDLHGNSGHGLHIASMAGSLACLYHGFAGLHCRHADAAMAAETTSNAAVPTALSLAPQLPGSWPGYSLRFCHHGRLVELQVQRNADGTVESQATLIEGQPLTVFIHGQRHDIHGAEAGA